MINQVFVSLISGVIFGFGLSLSGMINPRVVTGFLDVTGEWNPALLAVMAGALLVAGIAYRVILRQPRPVCEEKFHLPQNKVIDHDLVRGALMFGVGWGLAGICPGPAVAALALNIPKAYLFVAAMLAGMGVFELFNTHAGR